MKIDRTKDKADAHARQGARESSVKELRRMQVATGLRSQTKAIIASELRRRGQSS